MGLNFGQALEHLKAGGRVARVGWNGKGMWLALQQPGEGSTMTLPFIYIRTVSGDFMPWVTSQADVLAEDWTRG